MTYRNIVSSFVLAAAILASPPAFATEGVIQKVDAAQQKITIKHGPIDNLGMPAMTMVFKAADPAMLKAITPGEKVRFDADRVNGQITVTKIEAAK